MPSSTPTELISKIAAGSQVVVRDEEWLVTATQHTPADGLMVRCIGRSVFVRDQRATFFTNLDVVEPLDPAETKLVADDSPNFRRSRLFLEAAWEDARVGIAMPGQQVEVDGWAIRAPEDWTPDSLIGHLKGTP